MRNNTSRVFARKALACGLAIAMVATGPIMSPKTSVSEAKKAKSVTVDTQKELKKALKKNAGIIVIGKKAKDLTIPSGNYGKTTLVVNSPKASITNSGKFKSINIKGNAAKSWTEKSKDKNDITISSKKPVDLKVDKGAKVGNLVVNGSGKTESNISISGKVGNVTVKGTMSVNISAEGSGKVTKVVISASVTVSIDANGKSSVTKIDISASGADIGITASGSSSIGTVDIKASAGTGDNKTSVEIKAGDTAKVDNVKTAAENADVAVVSDGESTISNVKVEGNGSASVSGDSQNVTTVDVKDAGDKANVTINTPTVKVEAGDTTPVTNIVQNQSGQDIQTNVTKSDGTTETVIQPSTGGNTPAATQAPAATSTPVATKAPAATTVPQGSADPAASSGGSGGGGSSSGGGGSSGGGSSGGGGSGSKSTSDTVVVSASAISLDNTAYTCEVNGTSVTITARLKPSNCNETVKWSVTDASIASVSSASSTKNGVATAKIKGLKEGKTVIKAATSKFSASVQIVVNKKSSGGEDNLQTEIVYDPYDTTSPYVLPSDCRKFSIVEEELVSGADGKKILYIGVKNNSQKAIEIYEDLFLYNKNESSGIHLSDGVIYEDVVIGGSEYVAAPGQKIMFAFDVTDYDYTSKKLELQGIVRDNFSDKVEVTSPELGLSEGNDENGNIVKTPLITASAKNNSGKYMSDITAQILVKRNGKIAAVAIASTWDVIAGKTVTLECGDGIAKNIRSTDELSVYGVSGYMVDDSVFDGVDGDEVITYEESGLSITSVDVLKTNKQVIKKVTNNSSKDVLIERYLYFYKDGKLIMYTTADGMSARGGVDFLAVPKEGSVNIGATMWLCTDHEDGIFDSCKIRTVVHPCDLSVPSSGNLTATITQRSQKMGTYDISIPFDQDPKVKGVQVEIDVKDDKGKLLGTEFRDIVAGVESGYHVGSRQFSLDNFCQARNIEYNYYNGVPAYNVSAAITYYDRVSDDFVNTAKDISGVGVMDRKGTKVIGSLSINSQNITVAEGGSKKTLTLSLKNTDDKYVHVSIPSDLMYYTTRRMHPTGIAFLFDGSGDLIRTAMVEFEQGSVRDLVPGASGSMTVSLPNIDFSTCKLMLYGQVG